MRTKAKNKLPEHRWFREIPLRRSHKRIEQWIYRSGLEERRFSIRSTLGKKVSLGKIKRNYPFREEFEGLQVRRRFFEKLNQFEKIKECMVCHAPIESSKKIVKVWKSTYHQCQCCGHAFSNLRPAEAALLKFYKQNSLGKGYYQDKQETELRLKQIYAPKVIWAMEAFQSIYGRYPRSIADIGAGTGHLLASARKLGMQASGLEIDKSYQKFALKEFGIPLFASSKEILKRYPKKFELVVSFNVIEHVVHPEKFLEQHRELCAEESLVAVETPNFDSYTVWLQRIFPDKIRGYLHPYEHIQLFTPESLSTLMVLNDFVPTHRWCFGQDIRELAFQIFMDSGHDHSKFVLERFNQLQEGFDLTDNSDLIVFAALPWGRD